MKLYNNKVAPDLTHNTHGTLLGRGTKEPPILRNCTNSSEFQFLNSLRSGPIAFVSPLLKKAKRRLREESAENHSVAFESAYKSFNKLLTGTNPKLNWTSRKPRRSCTCVRSSRDGAKEPLPQTPPQQARSHSHCYLVPAKETFARIRKLSVHSVRARRYRASSAREEGL